MFFFIDSTVYLACMRYFTEGTQYSRMYDAQTRARHTRLYQSVNRNKNQDVLAEMQKRLSK